MGITKDGCMKFLTPEDFNTTVIPDTIHLATDPAQT